MEEREQDLRQPAHLDCEATVSLAMDPLSCSADIINQRPSNCTLRRPRNRGNIRHESRLIFISENRELTEHSTLEVIC